MTKRSRKIWIVLAVIAGLLGAETLLNLLKGPQALVLFENLTDVPIENIVFDCGSSRVVVTAVAPGATARVHLGGSGPSTLQLSFEQKGSKTSALQVQGFDPAQMSREGTMLVLRVGANGIERFQYPGEPSTLIGRLLKRLGRTFEEAVDDIPILSRLR